MITPNEEEVVLVDEENNALGTAPKSSVHAATTPLHRGFSLFLFNRKGQILLQQRSHTKKTWPLVWSNSVCGHPALNESNMENEICPILVGRTDEEPTPNKDEVEAVRWVAWADFLEEIETGKSVYSEWCQEEARILSGNERLKQLLSDV